MAPDSQQRQRQVAGGDINLRVNNSLRLHDRSQISASTQGGQGGAIKVEAQQVNIQGRDSAISASSTSGRGGSIVVDADQVTVRNGGSIAASTVSGRGGGIQLRDLDNLLVNNGTISASGNTSQSQAGDLSILARQVQVTNRGQINASTRDGQGGRITVGSDRSPAHSVQISGGSRLITEARGSGNAGNLSLRTQQLTVQGQGSAISASSQSGVARSIDIGAEQITIADGASVSASTQTGKAGDIRVNAANSIQLSDGRISVEANTGTAGDLNLTTRQLAVQGGSVSVRSQKGGAGNLTTTADTILLNNGELSATTGISRGNVGANITLNDLDLLSLRNGSQIQANANRSATGGNININSDFIVAVPIENSDITANAGRGNGGSVVINTQGVFGITAQPQQTAQSDITATSDQGVQGVVTINQPNVDPSRGLLELPTDLGDQTNKIDQTCPNQVRAGDRRGEFIVTGHGGLPANPSNPLTGDRPLADWVSLTQPEVAEADTIPESTIPESPAEAKIMEAQGWIVGDRGEVKLVAANSTVPASSVVPMPHCPQSP